MTDIRRFYAIPCTVYAVELPESPPRAVTLTADIPGRYHLVHPITYTYRQCGVLAPTQRVADPLLADPSSLYVLYLTLLYLIGTPACTMSTIVKKNQVGFLEYNGALAFHCTLYS